MAEWIKMFEEFVSIEQDTPKLVFFFIIFLLKGKFQFHILNTQKIRYGFILVKMSTGRL